MKSQKQFLDSHSINSRLLHTKCVDKYIFGTLVLCIFRCFSENLELLSFNSKETPQLFGRTCARHRNPNILNKEDELLLNLAWCANCKRRLRLAVLEINMANNIPTRTKKLAAVAIFHKRKQAKTTWPASDWSESNTLTLKLLSPTKQIRRN